MEHCNKRQCSHKHDYATLSCIRAMLQVEENLLYISLLGKPMYVRVELLEETYISRDVVYDGLKILYACL